MPYVVTENCIKCKYTECVPVCPVDCFSEAPDFLVIDPEECIECALCLVVCPAEAIYSASAIPESQQHFIQINKDLSGKFPRITSRKPPLPEADAWNGKSGKLALVS